MQFPMEGLAIRFDFVDAGSPVTTARQDLGLGFGVYGPLVTI